MLLAKSDGLSLLQHLREVGEVAAKIAHHVGLDPELARKGGHLHDIGKASPLFQCKLQRRGLRDCSVFRHEIASLFFLSLLPNQEEQEAVISMIVAHHKSPLQDAAKMGLLDLDNEDALCWERHSKDFADWSPAALKILEECGWQTRPISLEEARASYDMAIEYCSNRPHKYSEWKGLLMAADHLASGMYGVVDKAIDKIFITPDLTYYNNRQSTLYPLSLISSDDARQHTLVTAPTGAGKTDFLLRRCRGRVFYTLPFQASINAMYARIKEDLKDTDAQIYPLHAASILKVNGHERILSHQLGASIKVLTPYQMAAVAFGLKGYEAMVLDLKGCDVILDEIHTYTEIAQAMVLKIVEILPTLGCRVHIGTATMPTVLYDKLLDLLGGNTHVYEVQLTDHELISFDRHIIHKISTLDEANSIIEEAVSRGDKVLIVCNQVGKAQQLYQELQEQYPDTPSMLIHSRFKRGDRAHLEEELRNVYNCSKTACLVVSTQVVEVSLDISFDIMITECAPIDALIQRFGRINRKRTQETIGQLKPIYIVAPPEGATDAVVAPYAIEVLERSYAALPDGSPLHEAEVQHLLDQVYPKVKPIPLTDLSAYQDGHWTIKELGHHPKSALFDLLQIDSACAILEEDRATYEEGDFAERTLLEIPVPASTRFRSLSSTDTGMHPFILPGKAYDPQLGYLVEWANPLYYKSFEIL